MSQKSIEDKVKENFETTPEEIERLINYLNSMELLDREDYINSPSHTFRNIEQKSEQNELKEYLGISDNKLDIEDSKAGIVIDSIMEGDMETCIRFASRKDASAIAHWKPYIFIYNISEMRNSQHVAHRVYKEVFEEFLKEKVFLYHNSD